MGLEKEAFGRVARDFLERGALRLVIDLREGFRRGELYCFFKDESYFVVMFYFYLLQKVFYTFELACGMLISFSFSYSRDSLMVGIV